MDSILVGAVLLAVIPLVAWDAVGTLRAGFDNAFWAMPLEAKVERIGARLGEWHRLAIVWIPITVLLAAGLTAFTIQLAGEGEAAWSGVGLGAFLLVAVGFVQAAVSMSAAVGSIAGRSEVPPWARAAWQSAWWAERALVIVANLAYVAWGVAVVRSGYPADWAGWVAIASGGALAAWASLQDYFFQHMVLITPIALGLALVMR